MNMNHTLSLHILPASHFPPYIFTQVEYSRGCPIRFCSGQILVRIHVKCKCTRNIFVFFLILQFALLLK